MGKGYGWKGWNLDYRQARFFLLLICKYCHPLIIIVG